MKLTQYDNNVLESWRTSRLGGLYTNSYIFSREDPEELPQLERVAQILSARQLEEKVALLSHMNSQVRLARKSNNNEQMGVYSQMLADYVDTVMCP